MGVCALSASAVDYVSDSFEEGTDGMAVGLYKQVVNGPQDVTTNWFAAVGDASKLVPVNAAYAAINGEGPITNEASVLMLNLETEGNTLSRKVGDIAFSGEAPVFVDTLIQFTPSEDEPVIEGTDVKIALYVNAQSNLVVVHNFYRDPQGLDPEVPDYGQDLVSSVITAAGIIDPEKWYRLSMKIGLSPFSDLGTEIWLDGVHLTGDNAFDVTGNKNGGDNAFLFLNIDTALFVSLISFQGTGSLDELVVSDTMPVFPDIVASVMLTLVPTANVTFSPVGPVESGTEVTITAADWYRIASVTGQTEDLSAAAGEKFITATLTADADTDVTVTVAQVSGPITIGGTVYDLGSIAAWALNNNVGENDVGENDVDDYLLNVAPGTDATIEITSIVVDKVAGTTTITVGAVNPLVDFTALNGTLYVYTTADLGTAFAQTVKTVVELTPSAPEATLVITGISDEFIKAVVK